MDGFTPTILVLATEKCAYPGADAVGKAHQEYPANVHILRVPAPVLFPEDFYLRCYADGVDGILIAACGSDCPYHNAYPRLAARVDRLMGRLKQRGLGVERLRLTAICTVCIKAFLKEAHQLDEHLRRLGPVNREAAARLLQEPVGHHREGADRAA